MEKVGQCTTCGECLSLDHKCGPLYKSKVSASATDQHKDHRCKCSMRTSLVGDGCRYCNPQYYIDMLEDLVKERATDSYTSELMLIAHMDAHAEAKRKYEPLLEKMAEALKGFLSIVSDSSGVYGYHMNGDIAEWDEFDEINQVQQVLQEYQEMKDAK